MPEKIITIAKGHAPIITTATGAATSVFFEYLDAANSVAGLIAIFMTILGGYWMFRKYRSESLKADAETEQVHLENEKTRLDNEQKRIQLESEKITLALDKQASMLFDCILKKLGKANEIGNNDVSCNNADRMRD